MFVALGYPQRCRSGSSAAPAAPARRPLGREIAEALALSRTYDGYVWSQWFRQNGAQLGSFFAVIIGTGGLLSQSSAARLFTLSLPVSRERLLGARAAAGLGQVLALSVVPALVIVARLAARRRAASPLLDTLVYALCVFAGCAVFFSVAFLLSTMFANVWAPVVLALCVGPARARSTRSPADATAFSLLAMMHGEAYFRGSGLPWPMLLASAALSAALLYAGTRLIARQRLLTRLSCALCSTTPEICHARSLRTIAIAFLIRPVARRRRSPPPIRPVIGKARSPPRWARSTSRWTSRASAGTLVARRTRRRRPGLRGLPLTQVALDGRTFTLRAVQRRRRRRRVQGRRALPTARRSAAR